MSSIRVLSKDDKYTIIMNPHQTMGKAYMNLSTFKKSNFGNRWMYLHFGQHHSKITIKINNRLKNGTISIPQQISNQFSIPDLTYEYQLSHNILRLGPVIGHMILERSYENLSHNQTKLSRFTNYDQIKGVIYLFTSNTMDQENLTITGYYYNPDTKTFEKGVFPYPDAVYNRSYVSLEKYQFLKEKIGDKIFNYPYRSNKLKFWKEMSKDSDIKQYLPDTRSDTGISNVLKMLNDYGSIYIKPISLAGGKGILKVTKATNKHILETRENERWEIQSIKELDFLIRQNMIENKTYILQQTIYFKSGKRKVDFRAYFQKDESTQWKLSGVEAKIAKKGSIITNSKNRKVMETGEQALLERYNLTKNEAAAKLNEIFKVGKKVLSRMENSNSNYHLGDVAMDIILDGDLKIWILELQIDYAAEKKINRSKGERAVLPFILSTPLTYAKTLAGFNHKRESL
ncbi:YheC/YheD family protein [Chengkuizengella axinellae]|uniref:YheC/YheD family protein n=1 Tax=Chengkuizengella axinellae TaxID=3064388 RepID=A0ABT9IZ21_9BACL|nr:YheC/YheD family protein [Chengkuizengella sp. 2205SS18-9]MDP5274572.1 YheC/YheD family protein [Chengkuizengella sp. 2205SS18-9]